ncbi:MAG: methyltransferase domain-containing protein [Candidatus Spechtbacterales bacterium]|nr:methyltransferase domain-containing protein [Candidatus Spechtbacterales bacterium]
MAKKIEDIKSYYRTKESSWGYSFLLKGVRHFGYYPEGKEDISINEAQYIMLDKVAEKLELQRGAKILDAGCGEGDSAVYLSKKYGFEMYGIDLLKESIKKAKLNSRKAGTDVKFEVGDYSRTSFPDNYFDAVYTLETLVHSPDYRETLREFYRVLKPGGILFLVEYTLKPFDDWDKKSKEVMQKIIEGSSMHALPSFIHGEFKNILNNAGFIEAQVENNTQRIIPMTKRFKNWAIIPYQLIKAWGVEKKFINTTWGANHYDLAKEDKWRYVFVRAKKPKD